MLKAWIDGAVEPVNPGGHAAYGVVVKQGEQTIYSKSAYVGHGRGMSNNVAEYSALIGFLAYLVANPEVLPTRKRDLVHVYSDSQMLVNQMEGRWQVRGGLYKDYYDQAVELALAHDLLGRLAFHWIPREENGEADALSKAVLQRLGVEVVER